jgi:hypothetical protein
LASGIGIGIGIGIGSVTSKRWPRVLCNLRCGRLLGEVELVEHDVRVGVLDNDVAVADPGF